MRLLVKCSACSQKYDASKRKVGSRFRCHCGEVVLIEEPKAHEASVIHCAGCGGSREKGERTCNYCGSDFTIHELDLNTVCPGCLARVSDRARYCHHRSEERRVGKERAAPSGATHETETGRTANHR